MDIEPNNTEKIQKYLTFSLGEEIYAINIFYIQEVVQHIENIIKIHNSPDYILGIVDLQNKAIPIIDLRIFYQLPIKNNTKPYIMIIVNVEDCFYGILVDTILDIIDVTQENLTLFDLEKIILQNYIAGLIKIENATFSIFNIKKFIQEEITKIHSM